MAIEGKELVEVPGQDFGGEDKGEPSLRDSLEAAIEKVETPAEEAKEVAPAKTKPEGQVVDLNKPGDVKPVVGKEAAPAGDPAPKAWKASAQGKWAGIDPDVKSEIVRREKEVARVFGETGQIRSAMQQFSETVRPYEARFRATGMAPLEAVGELLKADHILSSAPMPHRAQYLATLIKDYGIDVRMLDDALAGVGIQQADPIESRLEQMLQQRLTPLQQFLENQASTARQEEQQMFQGAQATIEQMAQDNVKFPHFEAVRNDMADIIEMNARRNVYLSPEQAYTRAIGMNPEWSAAAARQQLNGQQLQQAQALNGRAQRALAASSSINGAPGGSPVGGVGADASLRDTIEAAFSQVAGR